MQQRLGARPVRGDREDAAMTTVTERGRTVVYVPAFLVPLSRPFFKESMPERGGVLRVVGKRWGPILRGPFGIY
jgi:hypothetical protein